MRGMEVYKNVNKRFLVFVLLVVVALLESRDWKSYKIRDEGKIKDAKGSNDNYWF